ncbi:Piwi domain-containing protein [Rhizophagus diaphanus]|nr:Piwi domain-containing protein [Rhizophagus diaphanus] [Rhizophagus sp. MUCL 43196]
MANITEFVKRPGLGRLGRPIRIRTNYFEITNLPDSNIHHYDIDISPEVPTTLNRKIFQIAENSFHDIRAVFDGRRNVYTIRPLDVHTLDVTLPEDNTINVGRRPLRSFRIRIKKVNEIHMEEIHRFLSGHGSISPNILTGIMALNVLIRHVPSTTFNSVGRIFYTNQDSRPLSGGVKALQGYFQSIRPTPKKMMINIDLHATAFYESDSLVQLVVKILNKRSVDDLRRIHDSDRTNLEKCLKNLKIYATHDENALNRRFRIFKVTNTSASNTIFDDNGNQTDVASYFQRTYNIQLLYPFFPCIVIRSGTYLPMEVCNVVEGQRYMRKLNERQTANMIRFTCQPPQSRASQINQGIQILNYRQNQYMQQFDFRVSNEMAITQARILPAPKLQYHPTSRDSAFTPRNGLWNLRDKKVATGATLSSWACAVFGNERDYPMSAIQKFIRELVTTCQDTGMNIPNKNPPIQHCNPQGPIETSLRQVWVKAGNLAKLKPQLILCILPNTGVPLYAEIKRVSDTVIGVASQCVQGKYIMFAAKKLYCANVCLKMNVKLGGMNSFIDPTQVPFITQRPTILMGASVTHPAPGAENTGRPSIAAVAASMDAKASRYAASIRVQTGRQEVISDLAEMVKELLKTFYMTCGRKPERILFYRNGVSEGQFYIVLKNEIKAIKEACRSLDEKYNPTITFVVVQKRHHTRFFPINARDGDRIGNCPSGTVVDSTIVHPFEFDFYLLSHPSLQGTSRPAHYHVLYDENGFNADSLQTLTYNLCYVFARCTRAVSIVPPVYYAHLVCARARFHASGENWSDPDTSEGAGGVASYSAVKAELLKVMYFM